MTRKRMEFAPLCDECGNIARTFATGAKDMLPHLREWSSSLDDDLAFVREDLVGSAAHVTMLGRVGLIEKNDARTLRDAIFALYDADVAGTLVLSAREEDVHMAIEAELTKTTGEIAKRLHTARSRNDQVSLALRLYVRESAARVLGDLEQFLTDLANWAADEPDLVLPAYTHRQRAQPISGAFLMVAWAQPLLRAGELLRFAMTTANRSPLGACACSGTSLPIDRNLTAELLGFDAPTYNALDTVGDRDFALDWTWAGTRVLLALGRMATDIIDFSTSEFAFIKLGDEIAAGSSMMPHKKNPDIFELIRGKSSLGIANVMQMLTLVKGLSTGYNRDMQDDRRAILSTRPLVEGAIRAMRAAVEQIEFDEEACLRAVSGGETQATDLAEALVSKKGVAFRDAYKAVGQLVHLAREEKLNLADISPEKACKIHPLFDADVLASLSPMEAVRRKESFGGTGPTAVGQQLGMVRAILYDLARTVSETPPLSKLAEQIRKEPFE